MRFNLFLKLRNITFKARYLFVFDRYNLVVHFYLSLKIFYLGRKLGVFSLQCASSEKVLQPVEHVKSPNEFMAENLRCKTVAAM